MSYPEQWQYDAVLRAYRTGQLVVAHRPQQVAMSPQITDHAFVPSKRGDSCDHAEYPKNGSWTVCDFPAAKHTPKKSRQAWTFVPNRHIRRRKPEFVGGYCRFLNGLTYEQQQMVDL